jgi:UDP-glucuronate 4-epimerase
MHCLVTGCAGFIGYHVAARLLADGARVTGLDNLNPYYDPALKRARLARLTPQAGFRFLEADLADQTAMRGLFAERFDRVIHLAAQAGVRYSLEHPHSYVESNLTGFLNVLEGCRHSRAGHLVYASSSSVYGANTRMPLSVHDHTDHPLSLYAATKKSNEVMAHAYSNLFGIPTTGLRFFTVYGPWGRPDMALFRFTKAILEGYPVELYDQGRGLRDFTYVDDVVEGVVRISALPPAPDPEWSGTAPDPASSLAPFRLYNIGNEDPVPVLELLAALETALGRKAIRQLLPAQPGDVPLTHADVSALSEATGFRPRTPIREGISRFVEWYLNYYGDRGQGTGDRTTGPAA